MHVYSATHGGPFQKHYEAKNIFILETKEQFRNDRAIQNDVSYRTSRESSLRQIEFSSVNNVR
jgi:hypothetical protein